ncbi:MAG: hypothetical protein JWO19_132 [Bryobacterales bacterium]|nr:hypothetical protein [Bryobacterales bacterium]
MADANRSELHQLLDRIPDQEIDAARNYLRSLVDPVEAALLTASEDDEPLSAHERAALAEAERRQRRGESVISHDEILGEFGLTNPER